MSKEKCLQMDSNMTFNLWLNEPFFNCISTLKTIEYNQAFRQAFRQSILIKYSPFWITKKKFNSRKGKSCFYWMFKVFLTADHNNHFSQWNVVTLIRRCSNVSFFGAFYFSTLELLPHLQARAGVIVFFFIFQNVQFELFCLN